MTLSPGPHAIPDGYLATIVTHLEMRAPPALRPVAEDPALALDRMQGVDLDGYRDLIRLVGSAWLWQARLVIGDRDLVAVLGDPGVEVFTLRRSGAAIGMLELDLRDPGACEVAFFGVIASAQGTGAARWMMNRAMTMAWRDGVKRVWLHTCTLDHPAASAFYRRTGFVTTHQEVELLADPRLTGVLPRDAGGHVPLAKPRRGR